MKLVEIASFVGDGDWIESKDQSSGGIRLIQTGIIGDGLYKDKGESQVHLNGNISSPPLHRNLCRGLPGFSFARPDWKGLHSAETGRKNYNGG